MRTILLRDADAFFHQHGSSPCLATVTQAKGIWLTDDQGRRYMDFHGNTAHHLGHGHLRLIGALKAQMEALAFSPRRYANEAATELAETLTKRFRDGQSRLLLTRGGSEAIETAIRLARVATGRSGVVAFEGSYHGHGLASLHLSSALLDPRLGNPIPDIHHIEPYWSRSGADASLAGLERVLKQWPDEIACFVAEPMRSNCHVPPADFWPTVSRMCSKAGVKLIFDEIPSGLGKTGRFFAHEHFGATPDLLVLGKALGGGMLPVAAVLGDAALNVAPELKVGHFTHEKNPLLARAALTTLQIIDDENLVAHAEAMGHYLEQQIEVLASRGLPVAIRGLGLMRVIEITDRQITAEKILPRLFELGVSVEIKDERSIGFSPPLTVTQRELDEALQRLADCLNCVR